MKHMDSVIANWQENKDIEAVIASGVFESPDAIQTFLDKTSGAEKANIMDILADMANALTKYIEEQEKEQSTIQEQIDSTAKSAHACLSYGMRDAHVKSRDDKKTDE